MHPKHHSKLMIMLLALLSFWVAPATGQGVARLQVMATSSPNDAVHLSLDALDAMEQIEFTTTTIWTDGDIHFTGVPLKALLDQLGLVGSTVEMVALNDYSIAMPVKDLEDDAPIVATRMNGKAMSVRDKGPYWVVFPYDKDPKYSTETNYSRSIWQLNRLKVVD
ncbi:molybdopterin-dependent oxidoreductase [uncultured Litoreibacter sp.]|uniref:molybdopterin-dependent oxidoreductase n=1 Tax=uncultured Litoreibacter sp. TaxID=1392394 RepID=UPI002637FB3D|nr:molybdopterin-dependent oxidoreductase [uncultured Litoreibacter sp.]